MADDKSASSPLEEQSPASSAPQDDLSTRASGSADASPASSAPEAELVLPSDLKKADTGDAFEDASRAAVSASDDEIEKEQAYKGDVFYRNILRTMLDSKDLGIDAVAKARIEESLQSGRPPQIACHEMVAQKVINHTQLGRSVARSMGRKELTSFLDVTQESVLLRRELDSRVSALLRENRIIPIEIKETDSGRKILHLAHENATRDLVLEAALRELMPDYHFVWHFALREVAGAYWLAGESEDVDSGMEAEALLDRLLTNAIDARSSDIHIDPSVKGEPRAIVKYRVDGAIQPKEVITQEQLERLRVRIENIARMPKVHRDHPSKGAFTRGGYDWRVQVQPHAGRHGPVPRMVLRRLQPDVMPMESLGYPQYFIDAVKSASKAPNGVVFWTGPTGSGKTESIHSAVVSVNPMARGLSVHTIEDPPEKRVSGYAVQMEIAEEDPARTALELLKSSLRADPDVVIFGEVRDAQLAKLVFEAANTGHLVFTTLHTNSALDAITRLDELNINGFLVSYIRGIAAQRLVRRLCTHCRQPMEVMDDYTRYVFDKYDVDPEGATLYKANPDGCPSCNFRGYHGRIAVAEFLVPSKEIVEASIHRNFDNLEDMARRAGWQPMGYMGTLHIKNGITDAAELSSKILELSGELE